MNKKMKISFLSMMVMGVALTTALPIVSCSQNEETPVEKKPLTVVKANAQVFNDLALLFAKVASPEHQAPTNLITKPQFDKILQTEFSKAAQPTIWTKTSEAFTLKLWNEEVVVPFDDAVAKINVSGNYSDPEDNLVKLVIEVQLKNEYAADVKLLTETLILGTKKEAIILSRGNTAALDAIGHEFAKTVNSGVINNKWIMNISQFDWITSRTYTEATYPEVWTSLVNYYSFKDSSDRAIAFNTIVSGIKVTGTFPANGNININLTLEINELYAVDAEVEDVIQVGVVKLLLTPLKGNNTLLNYLGTALTKVGNPGAFNNDQGLAISQYNEIISKTYTQSSYPEVWNSLVTYYTFRNPFGSLMPFNDVVDKVSVSGTYSQAGIVEVEVALTLKKDYVATDQNALKQIVQVGKSMISVSLSKGNQEALNALGTQFAKIARPGVNNNSASLLPGQYNAIVSTTYTKASHPTVWAAMAFYFTFINSYTEVESFDDIVSTVEVSGNFRQGATNYVTVKLNLKPVVFFTSDQSILSQEVPVGMGSSIFTTQKGNATALNTLGREFARVANPSATDNNGVISISDWDTITNATYNVSTHTGVWFALKQYFTFRDDQNRVIDFSRVVDNVVARKNPPSGNQRSITITLNLKNEYYTNDTGLLSQHVVIGRTS
ncbi:MAG: hypothetical protein ACRCVI_01085 [Mycoplasmoidaceae bacterium]